METDCFPYKFFYSDLRKLPLGMPLIDGGMKTTKVPVYVRTTFDLIPNCIFDKRLFVLDVNKATASEWMCRTCLSTIPFCVLKVLLSMSFLI